MNTPPTTARLILAAAFLPAPVFAQSLFHAPLPPQQQPQPQPAPAPVAAPETTAPTAAAQPSTPTTPPAPAPAPQQQTPALPVQSAIQPNPNSIHAISLFAVKPVTPHKFAKQDKVEIIVNETSQTKFEQSANDKESADLSAQLKAFPNIEAMYTDFVLRNSGVTTPKIAVANNSNYKGSGSFERKDRVTARISAIVTDVKPNGMLVLEARETVISDKECKSMVVSGLCDPKDITDKNTVTSSQLAHLVIHTEHAGDVKDAATKGWLPRVFDTLTGNN